MLRLLDFTVWNNPWASNLQPTLWGYWWQSSYLTHSEYSQNAMIWMCHFRSPFRHFSGCSPKSPSGPFRTVPQLSHINTPILATKKTVGSRNITLWYLYDIFIEFIDEQRRFFHPSISLTFLGWGHDWHGLHRGQIHWPAHFVLQCGNAKTGNDQITSNNMKQNQTKSKKHIMPSVRRNRCDETLNSPMWRDQKTARDTWRRNEAHSKAPKRPAPSRDDMKL